MKAVREEDYDELVERYEDVIDDSHEKVQDFSGYMIEVQDTLEEGENIDYLKDTLAASAAAATEVREAKETLDGIVQELEPEELEELDSLGEFMGSVLLRSECQEYSFEDHLQMAMMEALVNKKEELMQIDEQYHRATSLEADLGNISFKIAI